CICVQKVLAVDCSRGGLVEIPNNIPVFTRYLIFINNKVNRISNNTFIDLRNLKLLRLTNNSIVTIDEDAFKGLLSLEWLDVGGNKLPETLPFRQSLISLRLKKNVIGYLNKSDFEGYDSLTDLDVGHNSICQIQDGCFDDLSKLKNLNFWNNNMRSPDNLSFKSTSIRNLNLAENLIVIIKATSFAEHTLRNIVELDLSGNPFECTCELFWFVNWANENKHKLS
ncbi:hypothetical protein CAPTEDRAFT_64201, partial [Capitella teleta]